VASDPGNAGNWCGLGETLLLTSGAWALFFSGAAMNAESERQPAPDRRFLRACRYAFGAALPPIGLLHFVYPAGTASMIPAWMPFHPFLAYLTGSGHMLAGLAIILGIVPSLAASLEAAMITLFVLLLHVPAVVSQPHDRLQWTMFFIASAYAGAAWAVAASIPRAGRGDGAQGSAGPA
jgi:uncharacterized membrane protein